MREFTEEDLDNFAIYEDVRSSGLFNMFDPRARDMTGLSKDDYSFVMMHYAYLKQTYKDKTNE